MNYRKRYYTLLIVSPILVFIIYQSTISKTFKIKADIEILERDISRSSLAPMNINILENELKNLLVVLDKKGRLKEKDLFTEITNYCSGRKLSVRSYPLEHRIGNAQYSCNTSIVSIEGSFRELVKMINVFERDKSYTIRSISFDKYKDRLDKDEKLQVKLYIQIMKNEK
jgi:hypothetical protein